ncbi:MAG: hypothetical protein HKN16_12990 [Saprospiraceae bacterium]|nr:hypothetical protein [Saprospiraceae bacterium]
MKFWWGFLAGAFLGSVLTMWFVKERLQDNSSSEPQATAQNSLPDGFAEFLVRFSADSLYQMEHISFPLSGFPAYADSLTLARKDFRYLPDDWVLHKSFDPETGTFVQEFSIVSEDMVIENIQDPQSGFGMQRRFARLQGDWHLIYYAGINKVR